MEDAQGLVRGYAPTVAHMHVMELVWGLVNILENAINAQIAAVVVAMVVAMVRVNPLQKVETV